jgi:hypothetical protein
MFKRIIIFLIAVSLICVSCVKLPETEIAIVNASMDSLLTTQAEQYIPQEFKIVADSLNAAKALLSEQDGKVFFIRSYGQAQKAYTQLDTLIKNVTAYAIAKKDSVKQEVVTLLASNKMLIDSVNIAFKHARRGKDNRADLELIKGDLMTMDSSYAETKVDFSNGKYLVAKTKSMLVQSTIHNLMSDIKK